MHREKMVSAVALGCVLLVLLVSPVGSTGNGTPEPEPDPIQFVDEGDLSVTWPDDIKFELYNNTTEELSADIQVLDFESGAAGHVAEARYMLEPYESRVTLPGSGRVSVSIGFKGVPTPYAEGYIGSVVVSNSKLDLVLRKNVQLQTPGAVDLTAGELTPGVDAVTLFAYRVLPWLEPWCPRACSVPQKRVRSMLA